MFRWLDNDNASSAPPEKGEISLKELMSLVGGLGEVQYGSFRKLWAPYSGDPENMDYNILGSILGSPYFGKVAYLILGCP